MKFTTSEMRDAAKMLGLFVPNRSPLPSAECIYIEAKADGVVWLRTSDPMGAASAMMIHADVSEPGAAFVNAKTLVAVLGKVGDEVEVDADGKICTITNGDTEVTLSVLSDEFNKPMHVDGEPVFVSAEQFCEIVSGVTFAAAGDASIHSGAKFEASAGTLTVACLDGYRAAVRSCAVEGADGSFVIPSKLLTELAKIVTEEVKIFHSPKSVRIQTGALNVTVPQLQGDFLQWRNAIPAAEKTVVKGAKNDFLKKIDLLNAVNDQKKPIVLKFSGDVCVMNIQTTTSAIKDKIGVDMTGEDVTIGFNPRFLSDAIKAAGDEIEIHLNGALSPITIKGDGFLYLVLPVKVKE